MDPIISYKTCGAWLDRRVGDPGRPSDLCTTLSYVAHLADDGEQ
jgi:hypothetical protein